MASPPPPPRRNKNMSILCPAFGSLVATGRYQRQTNKHVPCILGKSSAWLRLGPSLWGFLNRCTFGAFAFSHVYWQVVGRETRSRGYPNISQFPFQNGAKEPPGVLQGHGSLKGKFDSWTRCAELFPVRLWAMGVACAGVASYITAGGTYASGTLCARGHVGGGPYRVPIMAGFWCDFSSLAIGKQVAFQQAFAQGEEQLRDWGKPTPSYTSATVDGPSVGERGRRGT